MFKKTIACLTFLVMLLTSVSSGLTTAFAADYVFPDGYWGYRNAYVKAVEENNVDEILKNGQAILDLYKNEESDYSMSNRAIVYNDFVNIYQAREQYDKVAEYLAEHVKSTKYLNREDSVKLSSAKLQSFKLNLDVYAESKKTSGVPNYNQRVEPANGVYIGRVYGDNQNGGVPLSENEGIISFYALFGKEDFSAFDWFISPYDDNTRVLHFAWNLHEENSGLSTVLSGSYDQHIIDTLKYIDSLKSPTMLRIFGEMNVWTDLADPQNFKDAYVKIAKLARQYAPQTALVFSPNSISNWNVDISDYYPGDEYVDWVGVSLYSSKYFSPSEAKPRDDFSEAYYFNGIYENPIVLLRDIVERYGSKKPIIISEGGAGHTMRSNGTDLSASTRKYMEQVYQYISMVYPQVKAAIYFDSDANVSSFNYSLSKNSSVKNTYFKVIAANPAVNSKLAAADTAYVKAGSFSEATDNFNLAAYAVFPNDKQTTVEYYVDGTLHTSTKELPYKASINTASLLDGDHKLEVIVKNGSYTKKMEYTVTKSGDNLITCKTGINNTPAPSIKALPSTVAAQVDGKSVVFYSYNIQDSNYLKLRDLAYIINGSPKQIEITWDGSKNAINIISNKAYTVNGSEMQENGKDVKTPAKTSSKLYLDGKEISLTSYNIDGSNYFKLRDMAEAFDFQLIWDGSVKIKTTEGYTGN